MQEDVEKKLYIDIPRWREPVKVDDFIIAVSDIKTNSVYHVSNVKVGREKNKMIRYYVKVFKSDLITCLKRDNDQRLIVIKWYSRNKK